MEAERSDPVVTPPSALPRRAPPPPDVRFLGRLLPRASGVERIAWASALFIVLSLFVTAATIEPDARGYGTHEQIKVFGHSLEPCGFKLMTGKPCPSCGFTTTFALAMHARPIDAIANQPFGFLVFCVFAATIPIGLVTIVRGASLQPILDRIPIGRVGLVLGVLWLLCWAYKVARTP